MLVLPKESAQWHKSRFVWNRLPGKHLSWLWMPLGQICHPAAQLPPSTRYPPTTSKEQAGALRSSYSGLPPHRGTQSSVGIEEGLAGSWNGGCTTRMKAAKQSPKRKDQDAGSAVGQ